MALESSTPGLPTRADVTHHGASGTSVLRSPGPTSASSPSRLSFPISSVMITRYPLHALSPTVSTSVPFANSLATASDFLVVTDGPDRWQRQSPPHAEVVGNLRL